MEVVFCPRCGRTADAIPEDPGFFVCEQCEAVHLILEKKDGLELRDAIQEISDACWEFASVADGLVIKQRSDKGVSL